MKLLAILKEITAARFFRNVFTIASGTAVAQVITMLFSPFITRLYGPEAFGVLGAFTSVVAIATTIAALTFPIAIILPKKDIEAIGIIKLSISIAMIMSFLTYLFLGIFGDKIMQILEMEILSPYLFLIPIVMFVTVGHQVAEQWLIRKKQFKVIARIAVYQSVILNSAKLSGGFYNPIGSVLVSIATIGYGIHMFMLLLGSRNTYLLFVNSNFEKSIPITKVAKVYSDFPIYRGPQVFLAALTQSMPVIMLTALFGPAAAGFYSIGLTVLGLPSQLIGKAIGDVFYNRISEAANNGEKISNLLIKSTILLAIIGLIPFGMIIAFGPSLFSFVFGSNWDVAGSYASWIALWSYALFISTPSIKTLPVLGAQRFYLIFTVFNILFRGGALLLGGLFFNSDTIGVALFGVTGAVLSIALTAITINRSKKFEIILQNENILE